MTENSLRLIVLLHCVSYSVSQKPGTYASEVGTLANADQ